MKCVRCDGRGLIEYVSGEFSSAYWMRGEMVTTVLTASEENPVYRRCPCQSEKKPEPPVAPSAKEYR